MSSDDAKQAVRGLLELEQRARQLAGHFERTGYAAKAIRAKNEAQQYARVANWLDSQIGKRSIPGGNV